ncbi:MAG: 4Fe-4S binding protein [Sphingobium sp.]|nr:4Fe-4S binding protein [Sphingobium sp.]MCP5400069.1 4Fe-4S binding protein [Sphingomonas sp.]
MTFVIAAPCVADYSCVDICPVNCIGPGPEEQGFDDAEQLYIDPVKCVDCGACVDACPVLAIYEEASLPDRWKHYAKVNRDYFHRDSVTA